MTYDIVNRGYM